MHGVAGARAVVREASRPFAPQVYEENRRLEAHCKDLESRKRAPLYQYKQEAELRAATDKAREAEARAVAAEASLREAVEEKER